MSITISQYAGNLSVGATEASLVAGTIVGAGSATSTVSMQAVIDTKNLIDGSKYALRVRRKVTATETRGVCFYDTFGNTATTAPIYITPCFIVGHSWDVTLQNIGTTTDVAIPYSVDTVG